MKTAQALMIAMTIFAGLTFGGVKAAHAASEAAAPPPTTDAAQTPTSVTCALTLSDGKAQFQQGEIIRLSLTFTSDQPGHYRVNVWQRADLLIDTFHITPSEGTSDPFAEERGGPFVINGYVPSPVSLADKPVSIPLLLNEQIRFDKPGTYSLSVTSRRILSGKAADPIGSLSGGQAVTSNSLEIQIVPADPAWAHTQLQTALAEIADHSAKPPTLPDPWGVLQFLGTRESAQTLLSLLSTDKSPRSSESKDYFCRPGLMAFPDRAWLIGEMERDLTAPGYTVTQSFLETLATLTARQQKAKDNAVLLRAYWKKAAVAVPQKNASALPMTLHSLLETAWLDAQIGSDAGVQSYLPDLTQRMAKVFDQLPALPQQYLLDSDWPRIRNPLLLPPLRRAWAAAVRPENNDFQLNDLILHRLYDLSPKEGSVLILEEIASPRPRVSSASLSILPVPASSALDATLAAQLTSGKMDADTTCALIARYATSHIFERVRSFYGDPSQGWACAPQASLLAYFLRVKPTFGAAMVAKALAKRTETGCYKYLFTDVAPLRFDANFQHIAIAHLNDPDPDVVSDAAQALGKYGSREVEAALWQRLRRRDPDTKQQAKFEWRLVEAMATGQNWYVGPAELRQIRALCVTNNEQREVDQYLYENNPASVHIDYDLLDNMGRWTIGPYNGQGFAAFAAKMAQFPLGAVFSWQDWGFGKAEENLFTRAQVIAKTHGMTIKRDRPMAETK